MAVKKNLPNAKKLPTADYILKARKDKLTLENFDAAIDIILKENGVANAPIPVIYIAKKLGFEVFSASFKDKKIAGIMTDSSKPLPPFKEKRIIVINREDYATRQNFTVAHEIAHFVLHCNETDNFYERYMHGLDKGQRPDVENMANAFAARLLMPKEMLKDFLSELPKSLTPAQKISAVESKFIVSRKAAARRLDEINAHI